MMPSAVHLMANAVHPSEAPEVHPRYNDLRNDWIRNITDKTPDFVEMDTTTKFKLIFAIHHRITAKFILRSYNLRKENLFR